MAEKVERISHKTGKPKRTEHIDVRMTKLQKESIIRRARRKSLDPSTWMRSHCLDDTDWDPDADVEWKAQEERKQGGRGNDNGAT